MSVSMASVNCAGAKGGAMGVAQPFLVRYFGDHAGKDESHQRVKSIEEPIGTLTTENRYGLATPFLVSLRGTEPEQVKNSARSLEEPLATVTTGGNHMLCEPYLVCAGGSFAEYRHYRIFRLFPGTQIQFCSARSRALGTQHK